MVIKEDFGTYCLELEPVSLEVLDSVVLFDDLGICFGLDLSEGLSQRVELVQMPGKLLLASLGGGGCLTCGLFDCGG